MSESKARDIKVDDPEARILCRYYSEVDRHGVIQGLFTTLKKDYDKLFGKDVYFFEVLGKHSEFRGTIDEMELQILSDDINFIKQLEREALLVKEFRSMTISGQNPFKYLNDPDCFDDEY
jgi:hypothetical protein